MVFFINCSGCGKVFDEEKQLIDDLSPDFLCPACRVKANKGLSYYVAPVKFPISKFETDNFLLENVDWMILCSPNGDLKKTRDIMFWEYEQIKNLKSGLLFHAKGQNNEWLFLELFNGKKFRILISNIPQDYLGCCHESMMLFDCLTDKRGTPMISSANVKRIFVEKTAHYFKGKKINVFGGVNDEEAF
jgi:hypothetical protein